MAASNFSDFELKAEFRGDYIVHTADGLKEVWGRGELIGRGTFGKVFVQQRKGGGQLRAVKEVALDPLSKVGISQELLAFVTTKDHDDLFVKFLGWYKNSHDIFFVMEYLKDGDLGGYMAQHPQRTKENAKDITTQILRGLEVLHKNKICHRDLKPPNVLIASLTPVWVKIADFGVAKQTANSTAKSGWGTDNYRAPEAFGGLLPNNRPKPRGLSYALDIWSLGSLLHELLTSQTPFLDATMDQTETGVAKYTSPQHVIDMGILFKYCHGMIQFPIEILQGSQVSKEGIDFVKSLLVASPEKRPTAASALQNPWLNRYIHNPRPQSIANAANISGGFQPPKTTEATSVKKTTRSLFQNAADTAELYKASLLLRLQGSWSTSNALLLLKNVEAGNADNVAIILKGKVDINNTKCQKGFQLAVRLGHFHIVELFLRNKINIETSFDGLTALQAAAGSGRIDIVKLLLDNEAYVNAEAAGNEGRTALQAAAGSGHIDIVKLLLDNEADVNGKASVYGRTALQAAAESGHIDIVKLLLDKKAYVNAEAARDKGRTALQAAAESGNIDIVELLLEKKANVNAEAALAKGRTALQAAAGNGHIDIVKLLLDNEAYVNAGATRHKGRTALQAAAESGNIDIVELLLDNEANVNAEAAWVKGRTALQAAAESGNIDIVKLLLDKKANVNARASRDKGRTALQAAAGSGHIEIVKLLLDSQADIHARGGSIFGPKALKLGRRTGNRELISILEAAEKFSPRPLTRR